MVPYANSATAVSTATNSDLATCYNGCTGDAACKHWAFDLDTKTCTYHDLLSVDSYVQQPNIVSGEKFCAGVREFTKYINESQ